MNEELVIGVDPGISGAIACYNITKSELYAAIDMPVETTARGKRRVAAYELNEWIANVKSMHNDYDISVLFELVGARPGQGVTSMFNFGEAAGVARGVLSAYKFRMEFITPQKWKKQFGLSGKDKDYSRTIAKQLFPDVQLPLKKDHNKAEAILISYYKSAVSASNNN